ncbi:hypothetical protein COSO111634_34250 [Corallococcus soli]
MVSTASTATVAKVQRQPSSRLSVLANGTPITVAMVSPSSTRETAWLRRARGTTEAATSAATPK